MQSFFLNLLKQGFHKLGISQEVTKLYFQQLGDLQFVKNQGPKKTAWLKQAGQFGWVTVADNSVQFDPSQLNVFINRKGLVREENIYVESFELFTSQLSEEFGLPVFQSNALEIEVTLPVAYPVKRLLIINEQMTFSDLHQVLQKAFGWENYHVYLFEIQHKKERQQITPRGDGFFDFGDLDAEGTLVKDFIIKGNKIFYTYDLGDGWEHQITLRKRIENYNEETPYLLSAQGRTPPEDCGGFWGFEDMLEALSDKKHPQHQEIIDWLGYESWQSDLYPFEAKPQSLG